MILSHSVRYGMYAKKETALKGKNLLPEGVNSVLKE